MSNPGHWQTPIYIRAWRKKQAEDTKDENITSHGFGHYGKKGQCICKCSRCFSTKLGCICKSCSGIGHWACRNAEFRGYDPVTAEKILEKSSVKA